MTRRPRRNHTGFQGKGAACRDQRRADAGERFFIRSALQDGIAGRKEMVDRTHKLSDGDLALMRRIDELHLDYPFAGNRMLQWLLRGEGWNVGRLHVATLMKKMGIEAIYRRPNTSKPAPGQEIYPYLLRKLAVTRPNQVWEMDLTYIPMARGFVYLCAVVDRFSRSVLFWRLSNTMEADFCIEAVEEALARYGKSEIFNTDEGSQFTNMDQTSFLKHHHLVHSMSRRGNCHDNSVAESFFNLLKRERLSRGFTVLATKHRQNVFDYIGMFYKAKRKHLRNGMLLLVEFEKLQKI